MSGLSYKDFIGGSVGGVAQVLAGQPFDIIKVRQATSTTKFSAISEFKSMLHKEGPLVFWRGSTAPLLGIGACVSIQFGVLENSKRVLRRYKDQPLSTFDYVCCGSIAGMATSLVSSPTEHFRIKMQVQGKLDGRGDPLYKNDVDCIKTIFRNHGVRGVYKGFGGTFLREATSFGSYFGAYEFFVNNYLIPVGGSKKDVEAWKLFVTGGVSGYFLWAPWYPFDSIKSRLHSDSIANPKYAGIRDCASKVFAAEGVAGFYKGFWICMLRAFPVNGFKFFAFELTMRLIS